MRIINRSIEKNGDGSVRLQLDVPEDAWHVYNLIAQDDKITSMTFRKVQTVSATGSTTTQKMKMKITISVEDIEYDALAHTVRVKGRNLEENRFVKINQYHTVELGLQRSFTLWKPCWDRIYIDRIESAADPSKSAEVATILLQPGLANISIISSHMTSTVAKVETTIPKKRAGSSKYSKGVTKFYDNVTDAIIRKLNFDVLKCVIVASPAFLRHDFMDYMFAQAIKKDQKVLLRNRDKFMSVHCSSGHQQALREVLSDPAVVEKVSDTKAAREVKALDAFFNMLANDQDRAFYGFNHVQKAHEQNAIETLLLTDDLFRAADIKTRKQYVALVDSVEEGGGEVHIFSAQHLSGQQLNELTGVAAVLRFPVHGVESDDDYSDDDAGRNSAPIST